jgi:LmbE family N-acetylglucosaminyl deacetylase
MSQTATTHATIEKFVSGQPHRGKVFVAVHAHQDDVPYFAAGLCAKLIGEGYTGYIVRTTNDEHSGGGTNAHNILSTEEEHAKMAATLGFKDVFELYYRTGRMEEISKVDLRGRLMLIYRMLKADTIISFHPDAQPGQHADRLITGRIAAEAASMCVQPAEYWEHVEAGFAARPIGERYYFSTNVESPFNRVVDIAPHIEKKIDAIA